MSAFLTAFIGILGAIIGSLIGSISTHLLHYIDRKSDERKIINESIHYLLEVYFQVNRMNTDKMFNVLWEYIFQEIKNRFPSIDDKAIETEKEQYRTQIKDKIIPNLQKHSFETLKNLNNEYESMLSKLATVLPIDACYLRNRNNLESIMKILSNTFEDVKNIEGLEDITDVVNKIKPTINETILKAYEKDLKQQLLVLLKKTDHYNCKVGKKAIHKIESTILTENEKRSIQLILDHI